MNYTTNRFKATISRINPLAIKAYYPPCNLVELNKKVVKFDVYELEGSNTYGQLAGMIRNKCSNIRIDLLNSVGESVQLHDYINCTLTDFNYPPFDISNIDKIRIIRIEFSFAYILHAA